MKRGIIIIGVTLAVTFGITAGVQISTDALAVVLGVVLGAAASIPSTILITYVLTRSRIGAQGAGTQPPPVVVVNAGDRPGVSQPAALPALTSPVQGRKWTVIGDVESEP